MRNAIAALEKMQTRLKTGSAALTQKLAEAGQEEANYRFANARYAGTNDVVVYTETDGANASVVAEGKTVAFIEFGAGVTRGGGYPGKKPAGVLEPGQYGQGKGAFKNEPWVYNGEPGNEGWPVTRRGKVRAGKAMTLGNPPNAAMYHASGVIREIITETAKEAFK
ncbi:MAG: hypothetical protein IKQ87_11175 [Clostridia bacterium]|nr:hypothetical protein [Clostridia bacterium]